MLCQKKVLMILLKNILTFREENGRSIRIWLDLILKRKLNKVVDCRKVSKEDYLLAIGRSPVKNVEIKTIIKDALTGKTQDRLCL